MNTSAPTEAPTFADRLNSWLSGAQKKIDDHWTRSGYTHAQPPVLSMDCGQRFVKITRTDRDKDGNLRPHSASVHAFIDITGGTIAKTMHKAGDVLKPASWRAPAKKCAA